MRRTFPPPHPLCKKMRMILLASSLSAVMAYTCDELRAAYVAGECCGVTSSTCNQMKAVHTVGECCGARSSVTSLPWNRPADVVEDAQFVYVALTGSIAPDDYDSIALGTSDINFTDTGLAAYCTPACGTELYAAATKASGGRIVRMRRSDPSDVVTILEVPTFDTYSSATNRTPDLYAQGSTGILSLGLTNDKLFFGVHNSFANTAPAANGVSGAGGVYHIENPSSLTGLAPFVTKVLDAQTAAWADARGVSAQGPNGPVKPSEGSNFAPLALTLIDGKMYGSCSNEDSIYELTESGGVWSLHNVTHVPYLLNPTLVSPLDGLLQSSVPTCIVSHGSTAYVALWGGAYAGDAQGAIYSVPNADIMDHTQWTLLASGDSLVGITKCAMTDDGLSIVATIRVGVAGQSPITVAVATSDGTVSYMLDHAQTKMSIAVSAYGPRFSIAQEFLASYGTYGVKVDHVQLHRL